MICGSGSFLFIKDFPDPELEPQFGFGAPRNRSRNKYFRLRNTANYIENEKFSEENPDKDNAT
jgi:hypothetical protein